MFLAGLSSQEKNAFLQLARQMIAADGVVTSEEQEMLSDLRHEMGSAPLSDDQVRAVGDACSLVTQIDTRTKILLELASLAYVDGDYDKREQVLLREIGSIWDVDSHSLVRIEDWGRSRVGLAVEAAYIIYETVI